MFKAVFGEMWPVITEWDCMRRWDMERQYDRTETEVKKQITKRTEMSTKMVGWNRHLILGNRKQLGKILGTDYHQEEEDGSDQLPHRNSNRKPGNSRKNLRKIIGDIALLAFENNQPVKKEETGMETRRRKINL